MDNHQTGETPLTDQQRIEMLEAENLRLNDELCEYDTDIRYAVGAIRSLLTETGLGDIKIPENGNMNLIAGDVVTKLMLKLPMMDFSKIMSKINIPKIMELNEKYKHLID